MMFKRISKAFHKSRDIEYRARLAFEEGKLVCESCGHERALSDFDPLTIAPCPKCGFKVLVPYELNDYLLFEPLGAGGVSCVYKALRRDSDKSFYAVKLLRPDKAVDEKQLHEFLYEAEAHHAVSPHPSIVPFVELDHALGEHFHVMEFIPGESVKRRVEDHGRLPEKTAIQWTIQTLSALRHILNKGYLYRDISPGNLLIREDNTICLIDFGLVLSVEDADKADKANDIVGTPEYMPPERIQQEGEDERSLIYSLGMLLIFMIKGEPLIKGGTHKKAALQHIASIRVAFSDNMLPPDISTGMTEVIRGMINYNPVDRPDSLDMTEKLLTALLAQ